MSLLFHFSVDSFCTPLFLHPLFCTPLFLHISFICPFYFIFELLFIMLLNLFFLVRCPRKGSPCLHLPFDFLFLMCSLSFLFLLSVLLSSVLFAVENETLQKILLPSKKKKKRKPNTSPLPQAPPRSHLHLRRKRERKRERGGRERWRWREREDIHVCR